LKIYIGTDLEGISGIDCIEMIQPGDSRYRESIERLMADLNAAIDGAFAGGATHVTVSDGHCTGKNFDISLLDPRAELDEARGEKMDAGYDGAFIIGAHAMAGTLNGFLDHTQSSKTWFNYYINGERASEQHQWAGRLAYFGIPLIMVSGDAAACEEAKTFLNPVECIAVKRGIGRNRAELLYGNDAALGAIRETAKRAMKLVGKAKPYEIKYPAEIKLELYRSDYCDEFCESHDVERLDARTVRKTVHNGLGLLFR
jgi:D-amino peptidase